MQKFSLVAMAAGLWVSQVGTLPAATTSAPAEIKKVAIKGEDIQIKAGKPLSDRSLVTEPPKLPGALSWTIDTRLHRGYVRSLAISPDGKQVATGGIDGMIRLWDRSNGTLVRILVGHDNHVRSLSWSPDGDTLASTGSHDGTMRLWNVHNGMPLRIFKSPKQYTGEIAWNRDGTKLLASGGKSGWLWVWNALTDESEVLLETGQEILSIDWSPDSEHVAATIEQGPVTVVSVASHKSTAALGDPTTKHFCVRFAPDGKQIAVGDARETFLYDLDGTEQRKLSTSGYSLAYSPDGTQLCTTNGNRLAQIWNPQTGKLIKALGGGGYDLIWRQADQLTARDSMTICAWNPAEGKRLFDYTVSRVLAPIWTQNKPIVLGVGTNSLSLWDTLTAKSIAKLEGHTDTINSVSWTRDGKVLATGSDDKTIRLWEAATGKTLQTLAGQSSVASVAWSPDGKTLASGGSDNIIRLWNLQGKELGKLEGHTGRVTDVLWSPRGNLLASASRDGTLRLWYAEKKQLAQNIKTIQPIQTMAFSPDGSILAGGTREVAVRFWQTGNGQLIRQEEPRFKDSPRHVVSVSWSPDGSLVLMATIGNYHTQIWSWQSGTLLKSLPDLPQVQYTTWSTSMVVGLHDGTARFYDAASLQIKGMIIEEQDHIVLLAGNGNYRLDQDVEPDFLFILQTDTEQQMLSVADFATKYKWKNQPTAVKFTK